MNKTTTPEPMSIDQANLIWDACYGDPQGNGWEIYTPQERELAIETRQQDHDRQSGTWGTWNISDRH
jgi:hypothetical protein